MLLGLDVGTTNAKAVLVDARGNVAARGAAPVSLRHGLGGAVEQDMGEIIAAARSAVRQAGAAAERAAVRAVGISAQGGALQLLDARGRPDGPVISWLDGRARAQNRRAVDALGREEFLRRTGFAQGAMALGQLLRLREESPDRLAEPNAVGFVGDVVVAHLCGRRAHDATSLSCAVLLNPALGQADPEVLRLAGIREGQLPDLLSARTPAGGLLPGPAEALGLPAGVPIAPAVHDQYAAALGVGATAAGDVMFSAGTAWVLLAASDRPAPPAARSAFVCTHLVEGLYGQILSMVNGGSAVSWALELTGQAGADEGRVEELLGSVPAGSHGARFRPWLSASPPAGVAAEAAGALEGLRLGHGPAHVLRAVVEGLAMELARHVRLLAEAGVPVRRLVMCGGGARGRATPQVVADATGLPVDCAAVGDAAALGAAMIARGLLEAGRPLAEIAAEMRPGVRPAHPGPDRELYRRMFEEHLARLPRPADEGDEA